MRRLTTSYAVLLAGWVLTRAFLLAAPQVWLYPHGPSATGDVRLYAQWSATLADARFPVGDPSWQYPPGAALLLVVPRLISGAHYAGTFQMLMLLIDAGVTALLAARIRRGGSWGGPWLWVGGIAALGPVAINRFDLVPAALVLAALLWPARPRLAGVLLGIGAVVKVWPVLLLGATTARARALAAAAAVGGVSLLVLLAEGGLPEAFDFLGNQRARGLQVETLAATPFMLARALGVPSLQIVNEYGAFQVVGPGVGTAVTLSTLATLVVLAGYLGLARHRPGDVALGLAALLAVVLVARVLSPQYLVWVLAVAAVLASGAPGAARRVGWLLFAAAALSQWVYPIAYGSLLAGDLPATLLLTLRNALLVAAAWEAFRARRAPVPAQAGRSAW